MFQYIKGELIGTEPNGAVIECGGIGYKFTVSANTVAKLASADGEVCLYTYLCVREDALELIGFYTMEELEAFKMLITVSGVGPKAALYRERAYFGSQCGRYEAYFKGIRYRCENGGTYSA